MQEDFVYSKVPERWATADLAKFATELQFEDIPETVVKNVQTYILDSLGCMIGGIESPIGSTMRRTITAMGDGQQAAIYGTSARASIANAALINGTSANALDFDENLTGIGHPGSSLIPPVLAIAEARGLSGKELLTAVVAGYEVGNRIGLAIQPSQQRSHEVWFVGTWQALSAVAASAKALQLTYEQTLNAYGIAGATAPLPNTQKWGWPVYERPIHWVKEPTGWPAWSGVLAALLAEEGFLGNRYILDGDTGFWRMAGSDRVDFDRMTRGLGSEWTVFDIGLKPFPCCRWHHAALCVIEEFRDRRQLDPASIEKIEVFAFEWIKSQESYAPGSVVDAQFSLPHSVAMILHRIEPGLDWVSPKVLADQQIADWSRRVKVMVDPEMTRLFHEAGKLGTRVVITLNNGERLEGYTDNPLGDTDNPMPMERIRQKFLGLTSPILGNAQANELIEGMESLTSFENAREILNLATRSSA